MTVVYYVLTAARLFLRFLDFLLLAYVICKVIAMFSRKSNPIFEFVFMLTEPLLNPIRQLLDRIPALQSLPIDLSVLIAYFIIGLLQRLI